MLAKNRRSPGISKPNAASSPGAATATVSESPSDGLPGKRVQELEAELALYKHLLENAREEFQAFAYSVSHDLRAPLRAIEGFAKILLDDYSKELSEEPRRFLQHVITNTQQLGSQIEDLLKFYRSGKNEPTRIPVETERLCREATEVAAGPEVKVPIVIEKMPTVLADPLQLREIFVQLISNALKFTSKSPAPEIRIGAKVEPVATTFFVRDNGVGFDPNAAERLFQVFHRLHSASEYPGNGVGLAIVKRLVEAHGGCVSATAQPGKGAVFCFSLPSDEGQLTKTPACELTV